jgi:hypothetical protein
MQTKRSIYLSHHENAGQNHDGKIAKFENMAQLEYLGPILKVKFVPVLE